MNRASLLTTFQNDAEIQPDIWAVEYEGEFYVAYIYPEVWDCHLLFNDEMILNEKILEGVEELVSKALMSETTKYFHKIGYNIKPKVA
jgi:hypothetical protein